MMGSGSIHSLFKLTMHFVFLISVICVVAGGPPGGCGPNCNQHEESCPTKCKGTDATSCMCEDHAGQGKFSCPVPDGECQFCSKKLGYCKYGAAKGAGYDGAGSKQNECCKEEENPNMKCVKSNKYGGRFYCLPPCYKSNDFLKCKDKNGREFESNYKSCTVKSGKQFKWLECPGRAKDTDVPRECGATGASCISKKTTPIDDCCINFFCDQKEKKCVPECKVGDSACVVNWKKEPIPEKQ